MITQFGFQIVLSRIDFQKHQFLDGNIYHFKTKSFTFDPTGNPTGWIIISHQADLNHRANQFQSGGTSEVYNLSGVLLSGGCSTANGVRFE